MKLIEEMRNWASTFKDDNEKTAAQVISRFADILSTSGALVPVPDDKPRKLVELYGHQKFLLGHHGVCEMVNPGQYGRKVSVRILANGCIIESGKYDVSVQPVRLVPIDEWEVEE